MLLGRNCGVWSSHFAMSDPSVSLLPNPARTVLKQVSTARPARLTTFTVSLAFDSNRPMLHFPPLQQLFRLDPVGHRLRQGLPELRRVVAMDEVSHLVGDHIFKSHLGGLDEAPVDAQYVVFTAGAPGVFGIVQAGTLRLYFEPFAVSSSEGPQVGLGTFSEPLLQRSPYGSASLIFG